MSFKYRWEALSDVLKRYASITAYSWKIRDSLSGGLLSEDEAEFLPAALSLQEKPVSTTARWTGRLLMLMIISALAWSIFGHMDIVVNAKGKIIPSSYTKTIASVDVASVRAVHVNEGQQVKAGEVLVELDTSGPDAEHDKASDNSKTEQLEMLRSEALINAIDGHVSGGPTLPALSTLSGIDAALYEDAQRQLRSQFDEYNTKLQRFNASIATYAEGLPLAQQRANNYKLLAENHDVSRTQWIEKEQQRIEIEGQLKDARNQRAALIAQTRKEAHDKLNEARKKMAESLQDARRAGEHSKLLKLTSPIDGSVQQLAVHTVGGVVPATQALMLIVPREHKVEVQAFVENKDIGFVHEGQRVEVKIDTFEYTKYGTVPGVVSYVARDAQDDRKRGLIYELKVILDQSTMNIDGKEMRLGPGMSVNVEVKTGDRRVIEYLLSPLIQHQHEALHER
ncbi:HlyD family type I secretion periplasmic adaptor subunit [Undibacterium sp. MH2W]|uniref:HlyD family type I secretion periplasmic adaptor subunit n=1 Tax=Undibacterium sp. MH2W TaxID=3413044 RepID=UPI003BF12481